jgi:threonine aldolase
VPLHVDGARFFNAAVALGVSPRELAAPADSVTFCLSKGLGCPVGSVVVGSKAFIGRAHRARKLLGGGLRQAGILAAAGLVALQDGPDGMVDRLADDHANARRLAEGMVELPGILSAGGVAQPAPGRLDPDRVVTNFVLFKVDRDRRAFIAALRARNVLIDEYAHGQLRAVTHHDVAASDIDPVLGAIRGALADTGPSRGTVTDDVGAEQLQGV